MSGSPSNGMPKAVVPSQIEPVVSAVEDTDQNAGVDRIVQEPSRDGVSISDKDSALFQGGVQRVRAITSLWSKNTMWLMFVL